MTVIDFIVGYDNAEDKQEYCKQHIVTKYINYETKITQCKRIANSTMFTNVDGIRIFGVNSTARCMLFDCMVIDLYTDIDINFSEVVADYNALCESEAYEDIIDAIPERELERFLDILEMVVSDIYENERDIVSLLDNKFKALSVFIESISDIITPELLKGLVENTQNVELDNSKQE